MTVEELLSRLDAVHRSGRGWVARCPAHDDHDPSLSVRDGDKGILLKCWPGCSLTAICEALGISPAQLFYDGEGPIDRAGIQRQRFRRQAEHARKQARGRRADALREADAVIRAATGIDISAWADEQLDAAMKRVCGARELIREELEATQCESTSL